MLTCTHCETKHAVVNNGTFSSTWGESMCTICHTPTLVSESLHKYDVTKLNGELTALNNAADLLNGTNVPKYVHLILTEQIEKVQKYLYYGFDEV